MGVEDGYDDREFDDDFGCCDDYDEERWFGLVLVLS